MPTGTTALVTGATHGIGRATAFALGRAGYRVGVCARTAANVEAVVAELEREGIAAAGAAADVGDPEQVERAVAAVSGALGEIGLLVNNAGVLIARPFERADARGLGRDDGDEPAEPLSRHPRRRCPACGGGARGPSSTWPVSPGATDSSAAPRTRPRSTPCSASGARSCWSCGRKASGSITICPGSVDTGMLRDQPMLTSNPERILLPEDVAASILHAAQLPGRALVSELDIRPTNP